MTYNLERMGYVPPLLLWSAEQFRRGGRSSACMDYIYYTERKRMDDLVCNYFFEFPINLRTSLSHVQHVTSVHVKVTLFCTKLVELGCLS